MYMSKLAVLVFATVKVKVKGKVVPVLN